MTRLAFAAALLLAVLPAAPALANDSEAAWALGGLTLKTTADISMDREELYLSASEVRVDYTYTNHADSAREVMIAFPLPALPEQEGYLEYAGYPDWDALYFSTTVDGEPVEWDVADRALVGEKDVTDLVLARGWPVHWVLDYTFLDTVLDLPRAEQDALVAQGLLLSERDGFGTVRVTPAWRGQRFILRTQTFPAKSTVAVSHRYTPLVGGSVGGMLYPQARRDYPEGLAEYRTRWCLDDAFLAGIDRRLASAPKGMTRFMSETWLGYVLSTGANWHGPIRHFRLVVDKGEPGHLVSFCMDGVKKISPTQFEVVKENFEPARDLDVLIVRFDEIEE